jgi:hypothetical protein
MNKCLAKKLVETALLVPITLAIRINSLYRNCTQIKSWGQFPQAQSHIRRKCANAEVNEGEVSHILETLFGKPKDHAVIGMLL